MEEYKPFKGDNYIMPYTLLCHKCR